jgi:hypothetical protein
MHMIISWLHHLIVFHFMLRLDHLQEELESEIQYEQVQEGYRGP